MQNQLKLSASSKSNKDELVSGIEEALDDVKAGRVTKFKDFDEFSNFVNSL